ncbi:hypothetical protein FNV43_RR21723 [Rhamnella rubrinervis]|uniref:Uncharacterized protein n=1 Tax=Rhamnella rubrinervis TaxID=2594499 RepID=A0A8K0GRV9_9ROSA|nr:hypothetical protein FNV43_RR21723 [Rhamnella rubrinervis]
MLCSFKISVIENKSTLSSSSKDRDVSDESTPKRRRLNSEPKMDNKKTLKEDHIIQNNDKEIVIKDVEVNERSTRLRDEKKQFYVKEFLSQSMMAIPLSNGQIIYKDIDELVEFQKKYHKYMYWWYLAQLKDDRSRATYRSKYAHYGYEP